MKFSKAYNMDCVDGMKQLQDNSIDLTVTSPPYDNLRDYHGYVFDWKETIKELFRITKDGGAVVWVVNDQTVNESETGTSFRQALFAMECGFKLHDTMIWDKEMFVYPCVSRYRGCFEYMFIFIKGKIKTYNMICDRENKHGGETIRGTYREKNGTLKIKNGTISKRLIEKNGMRFNIWRIPPVLSNAERTNHPAQFPERLVKDHIISWSNEGDTVLDPFLGSGTTRIAAYDLSRNFIGYEIDQEYFKAQEERFATHTAQMSLFVD